MLANKRVWEAHRGSGVGVVRDLEGDEASLGMGMCSAWAIVHAALNAAVPGVPYT